jgi:hypothetical protein
MRGVETAATHPRASTAIRGITGGGSLACAPLGLLLILGCAGDLVAVDGGFRHRRHGYTLSEPEGSDPPWKRVEIKGAAIAFRRRGPQTISVQSSCRRSVTDPAILSRHLVIGIEGQQLQQAGPTVVDGRNAWTQTFDTPRGVRIKTVTVVAGECVIDWILAAQRGPGFEDAERAFDAWWLASRLPGKASSSGEGG